MPAGRAAYIEPERRENRGKIEARHGGPLPQLIKLADIQGDLHAQTTEIDGRASLEEMARGARANGYRYLAITDHSQRVAMARGQRAALRYPVSPISASAAAGGWDPPCVASA